MNTTLGTVTSKDGTRIVYEVVGSGPPVILIGGAFNDRSTVMALATTLASDLAAVAYDRRGRGDSGDSADQAVEREIEDLAALIERVGGSARLFGHSSGAVLALEAAIHGLAVDRLAVYEPPYIVEGTRPRPAADATDRLRALLADGHPDDAVALFQTEVIGLPPEMVDGMRASAVWGHLVNLAPSLPRELELFAPAYRVPAARLGTISVPTLAMAGSRSSEWVQVGTRAVTDAIPGARFVTLEGQDHGVLRQPEALRPVLLDFYR